MVRKILKALGYLALFLVFVVVFMYWTFPVEKARHYVEREAQKRLKLDVTIGALELSGFNGIEAEDILVRLRSEEPAEVAPGDVGEEPGGAADSKDAEAPAADAEDKPEAEKEPAPKPAVDKAARSGRPRFLRIDRLEAHVGLWDLMFGKRLDLRADVDALGGAVRGIHVARQPEGWVVAAEELDKIALGGLPFLEDLIGARLGGKLSGTFSFDLARTAYDSRGFLDITIEGAKIRQPELKNQQYGTFRLTDIELGTVTAKIRLDEASEIPTLTGNRRPGRSVVIHFEELQAEGGDIEGGLEEQSVLTLQKGQPFSKSLLNILGSFRIDPRFFEKTEKRDGEVEKPNAFLRYVLNGDRKWKRAEREGVYGFRCTGPLSPKPQCAPTMPLARGRYSPSARRARTAAGDGADEEARPATTPRRTPPPAPRSRWSTGGSDEEGGTTGPAGLRDSSTRRPVRQPRLPDRTRPVKPRLGEPAAPYQPPEPVAPAEPDEEYVEDEPVDDGYEEEVVDEGYEEEPYDEEGTVEEGVVEEGEEPVDGEPIEEEPVDEGY